MVEETNDIDWREQCQFCSKGINSTYCYEFERFSNQLKQFLEERKPKNDHASVELTCSFFCLDKKIYEQTKSEQQ